MNKAMPRIPNYLALCKKKKKEEEEEGKVKDIETKGKVIGFDF